MTDITRDLISDVEQFYYREARMLDNREYQQWLKLVTTDIKYRIPVRFIPQPDPKKKDTEAFLSVEQELSQGLAPDFRDENFFILSLRVMRAFKLNSWTDNPPARTRRFISNVEVLPSDQEGCYETFSNTMITWSRHQKDNHTFTAQRKDVLRVENGEFRIAKREVIIDWNVITGPSLSIFY
ncbi:aromatic-ring-hydroxylating dioxygenase subunit beta [Endozoicomonas sp.]|uniref:aromatic-ring-hydroxylating dioxygenase subunit beta n=1 Tax=Endozoicomonas sp. TaxID=1892382 RepID=UPI002883DBAF|nr:aromatic-ring-hydroxylating dioxygenase subunit beta [Endozoicomonas sp.]